MLSPLILSRIYTKAELIAKLNEARTQYDSLTSGEQIQSVGSKDTNVTFANLPSAKELEEQMQAYVEALQILGANAFGNDLLRPAIKYVY